VWPQLGQDFDQLFSAFWPLTIDYAHIYVWQKYTEECVATPSISLVYGVKMRGHSCDCRVHGSDTHLYMKKTVNQSPLVD